MFENKLSIALAFCAATLIISSCGITGRVSKRTSGKAIESGTASWYGPKFHGKMTANGEIYDMNALTAAHRTLPFNTFVRVQNLDNAESVVVRINDRGPFAKNRIIDLSKKAATEIGMIGPGTARVRLYPVEGDFDYIASKNLKTATYTVQLGSFRDESKAIKRSREIRNSRVEKAYLNNGQPVYRIYYGTYTEKQQARRDQMSLRNRGYDGYVKQLEN